MRKALLREGTIPKPVGLGSRDIRSNLVFDACTMFVRRLLKICSMQTENASGG